MAVETGEHFHELCARYVAGRIKYAVRAAVYNAELIHLEDVIIRPAILRNISE